MGHGVIWRLCWPHQVHLLDQLAWSCRGHVGSRGVTWGRVGSRGVAWGQIRSHVGSHGGHTRTGDAAANLEEVVRFVAIGDPEGDVLVAGRVLGVGLEGGDLARLELLREAPVIRPEEADVCRWVTWGSHGVEGVWVCGGCLPVGHMGWRVCGCVADV
eukprot:3378323-Prymnesium_polylepis.1